MLRFRTGERDFGRRRWSGSGRESVALAAFSPQTPNFLRLGATEPLARRLPWKWRADGGEPSPRSRKLMKTFPFSLSTALTLVGVFGGSVAFGQPAPAGLRVFTSIEVEFATETNRYYALQGSSDLQQWTAIGDPVFGNGQVVKRMFSTRSGELVSFGTYRLAVVERPSTNSYAPWDLAGRMIQLSDDSGPDLFRFVSPTDGLRHASGEDRFDYTYLKTAENVAELNVVLPEGRSNHVVLQFSAPDQGTFVLEQYRDARLKGRDLGTFTLSAIPSPSGDPTTGQTNAVPETPAPPSVPADLSGRAFSFSAGGEPDRVEFVSATAGFEREDRVKLDDDGGRKPFTYTYEVSGTNQAALNLDFGRGRVDAYDLTFTVGEQGAFVRRELRDGVVHDVDRGRFSGAGPVVTDPISTGGTTSSGGNSTGGSTATGGSTSGTDADYWNHGVAPEPGDDKGGTRPDPTTDSGASQGGTTVEPGDDKGGNGAEPGDDHGSTTVEPGDDQGGTAVEPGDDNGGNGGTVGGTTGGGTPNDPPAATPTAPAALTGLALDFGSDLYRFASATAGSKNGSSGVDAFTYEYQPGASGAATLKVVVKSDRWFEFALTFGIDGKSGTYRQREFRSGALKSEKQGSFAVVP